MPRLVLDLALIEVAAIEPVLPLGDLLDRLAALERRLGSNGGRGGPAGGTGRASPPSRARAAAPAEAPGRRGAAELSDHEGAASHAPGDGAVAVSSAVSGSFSADGSMAASSHAAPVAASGESRAAPGSASVTAPGAAPGNAPAPDAPPGLVAQERAARGASDSRVETTSPPAAPGNGAAGAGNGGAARRPGEATAAAPEPRPDAAQTRSEPGSNGTRVASLDEWERMLPRLGETHRSLAGFFEHAKVLACSGDRIELGFTADLATLAELATEPDNLTAMKRFLREYYGRPMDLAVRMLGAHEASPNAPARSVVELNRARADEEKRKREVEARTHPIYKKVLDIFGRPVKEEIRTDV